MQYLTINDSYINFKSCKWALECLLLNGCDQFAYHEHKSKCVSAKPNQEKIRGCFDKFFISNSKLEAYFYNTKLEPWHSIMPLFKFSRDSLPLILDNMGCHLLDFNTYFNLGVGNWQFYKQGKLIGGCSIDDDYFILSNPSELLKNKLSQLRVEYELTYT